MGDASGPPRMCLAVPRFTSRCPLRETERCSKLRIRAFYPAAVTLQFSSNPPCIGDRRHALRLLAVRIEGFGTREQGGEIRPRPFLGPLHRLGRRLVTELRSDRLRRARRCAGLRSERRTALAQLRNLVGAGAGMRRAAELTEHSADEDRNDRRGVEPTGNAWSPHSCCPCCAMQARYTLISKSPQR